jgi:LysM repeat protein
MVFVSILRNGIVPDGDANGKGRNQRGPRLKPDGERLIIKTRTKNNRLLFKAPYAPKEVTYSGYENVYEEITRPDRKPIVRRSGESLRRMSMQLFVGSPNRQNSVNTELRTLEKLAASRIPLIVEYDPRTYGFWHISSLSYNSVERRVDSDNITRATVDIEFVEVPDPTVFTLNLIKKIKYTDRPKSYTTKKKDTLESIVKRFYGTTNKNIVKAVAKANNIKNPKHIKPGQKITLP